MALYNKWAVKNDFAYVLQFFSLISDGLGSVTLLVITVRAILQDAAKLSGKTENIPKTYKLHLIHAVFQIFISQSFLSFFISKLLFELRCLCVFPSVCPSVWVSFCKKFFFVQNGWNLQIRWTDISNSRIQARRAWSLVYYKTNLRNLDNKSTIVAHLLDHT